MAINWETSGNAYGIQDGAVYVKRNETLDAFVWGGRCMKIEEGTETLGGFSVTTRFNPRGGVERDAIRMEPPGETTGSLVMKRLQADRAKTDLRSCLWDLDLRMICGGLDRDAPMGWEEITRYCQTKMSDRAVSGINWEGDEDALVTFSTTSLSVDDIYRVGGSEATAIAALTQEIVAVDVCQPGRCPDRCDDQEECIVVAVTVQDSAPPYLLVNLAGGDDDNWTATALTNMGNNSAADVVCVCSFVVVTNTANTSIIYSDDLGATQVYINQVTYADWTTGAPTAIDAIDQTFIVMTGSAGYAYISTDAARTWSTVLSGEATASNLTEVMIARDNPMVIYAASSAADVILKSENGGETWFRCGLTGAAGHTALYVINQSTVLTGTAAGQLWQTTDGGTTWTEQTDLPGVATKATHAINDIAGCGCGVLWMVTTETGTGAASRAWRNVDGGAQGRWYVPADIQTLTAAAGPDNAIACCGPNHAVAVGGATTTIAAAIMIA
jgi:photosystem II stability/assembly factor-like uncharacterized protein